MQCTNNLKQLGLACHNYMAAWNGCFPCAGRGNAHHGLFTRMLPYLEQDSLYGRLNFNPATENTSAEPQVCRDTVISAYVCPSFGFPVVASGLSSPSFNGCDDIPGRWRRADAGQFGVAHRRRHHLWTVAPERHLRLGKSPSATK